MKRRRIFELDGDLIGIEDNLKRPFSPVAAMFFAYGPAFDARAFCGKHGLPWKARDGTIPGSAYAYRFEPQLMHLSNDDQLDVVLDFLDTNREVLLELRDQTEVRRICIQTNHSFIGSESATAACFSVEFMKALCELEIELGAYVAVQCDSSLKFF